MECKKATKLLFDYIDKQLAQDKRQQLAKHLETCAHCRQQLRSAQELLGLLKQKKVEQLPDGYWVSFWPRLQDKIRARQSHRVEKSFLSAPFFIGKPVPVVALGSILIILIMVSAGVLIFKEKGPWPGPPSPRYPILVSSAPADLILARAGSAAEEEAGENDFALAPAGVSGRSEMKDGDFILARADWPGQKEAKNIVIPRSRSVQPGRRAGEPFSARGEYILACGFPGGRVAPRSIGVDFGR